MKLLYDENLSPALVAQLADAYPGSAHVDQLRLGNCTTRQILDCLQIYQATIEEFGTDAGESVLLIP